MLYYQLVELLKNVYLMCSWMKWVDFQCCQFGLGAENRFLIVSDV